MLKLAGKILLTLSSMNKQSVEDLVKQKLLTKYSFLEVSKMLRNPTTDEEREERIKLIDETIKTISADIK